MPPSPFPRHVRRPSLSFRSACLPVPDRVPSPSSPWRWCWRPSLSPGRSSADQTTDGAPLFLATFSIRALSASHLNPPPRRTSLPRRARLATEPAQHARWRRQGEVGVRCGGEPAPAHLLAWAHPSHLLRRADGGGPSLSMLIVSDPVGAESCDEELAGRRTRPRRWIRRGPSHRRDVARALGGTLVGRRPPDLARAWPTVAVLHGSHTPTILVRCTAHTDGGGGDTTRRRRGTHARRGDTDGGGRRRGVRRTRETTTARAGFTSFLFWCPSFITEP
jgi:hypothetical protein